MDEGVVALMGCGGRFRAMIVSGEDQHAAIGCGTRIAPVLQRVARTVHARTLAVPDAENTVISRIAEQADLLRTPNGGGAEILVDPRLEMDVMLFEQFGHLIERDVVSTERRPGVTRYEARSIEPCVDIALALHQRQADKRLRSRQEHAPRTLDVPVFEPILQIDTCFGHDAAACIRARAVSLASTTASTSPSCPHTSPSQNSFGDQLSSSNLPPHPTSTSNPPGARI